VKYAIELNPRQSQRVLEQAIRVKAPVLIEPRTLESMEGLKGTLQGGSAENLQVYFCEPSIPVGAFVPTSYCDARLFVGDNRYLFTTSVLELDTRGQPACLTLARPETIQVLQRRKFWRATLRESSEVSLHWSSSSGEAEAVGALCNISPDGMACRLSRQDADAMFIGDPVRVRFALPFYDRTFDLTAVICNKTPGASSDSMLVGLQFVADEQGSQEIRALREYLFGEFAGQIGEETVE